jgi:hypothetical protein
MSVIHHFTAVILRAGFQPALDPVVGRKVVVGRKLCQRFHFQQSSVGEKNSILFGAEALSAAKH